MQKRHYHQIGSAQGPATADTGGYKSFDETRRCVPVVNATQGRLTECTSCQHVKNNFH